MRLLRVEVISAATCGGLLDGFSIQLKSPLSNVTEFSPLCLIGPNGAGKSQFLQVLAEMFQSAFYACVPDQERGEGNTDLQFQLEYLIGPFQGNAPIHVRVSRQGEGKRRPEVRIERRNGEEWINCPLESSDTAALLPTKVVGYTSGNNETLSLPFLISRSGYADEVTKRALGKVPDASGVPDTRLMLIDYGTHLEVLVANLILGSNAQRTALLEEARLQNIHSFRCVVQLAPSKLRNTSPHRTTNSARKGVQLTAELERYLEQLQRCATCYDVDPIAERYTFDFRVSEATRKAFHWFFSGTLELYTALHKLAMLNDLAIPKPARIRFKSDTANRRFASRLPEPQDEEKVFRFERVTFIGKQRSNEVDYVSLSDGEHQLVQLLGTFCMVSYPNVMFLLDEPESHFNPQWRVKFLSRLKELPTLNGKRNDPISKVSRQECLLTTHAPFVPSDMPRENVLIFRKENDEIKAERPSIETYGTTFDSILEECFGVRPPISDSPKAEIEKLMDSTDPKEIQSGLKRLGASVEKAFLTDHLRQVLKESETK